MKSCMVKLARRPRKASITDSAVCLVSASTTPLPCVLSSSLTITGAVPTSPMIFAVSLGETAKAVVGMPIFLEARIWCAWSLSLLAVMPALPFVYRKNKRPVGHEQANTDPGILPLACLLVVTLGGIQVDLHRFWLAQQSMDV